MIRVTIKRGNSNRIESFTLSGHANFAEHGNDIVCAGASAVSFGTVNSIIALTNVEPEIKQGKSGLLTCVFPADLPKETEEKVQLLLESMVISLQTIERDYGKHLKINFHS